NYTIPLSCAETLIPGSDPTLLMWGTPDYHCESPIQLLNSPPPSFWKEGLSPLTYNTSLAPLIPLFLRSAKIELIDLRTRLQWDMEAVVESVHRTKRLVIVHEAGMTGGVGGEIAADVSKRAFLRLEAPVRGIAGWGIPVALQFEKFNMPDEIRILDGIVGTLSY
ncbi:TK C-terminal domain-like protein, partial [Rhizopogon vinicolor AM-OR11-026]